MLYSNDIQRPFSLIFCIPCVPQANTVSCKRTIRLPFSAKNHISAQYVPMTFHVSNTFYFINKELADLIFLFTFFGIFFFVRLFLALLSCCGKFVALSVPSCFMSSHLPRSHVFDLHTQHQRHFYTATIRANCFLGFTCFLHATLNIHKTFLCFAMLFDAFYAFYAALCLHIKMARDFGEKLVNHSHKGNFTIHQ